MSHNSDRNPPDLSVGMFNSLYRWADRHQTLVLIIIAALILLGGYLEQNP
jgi:hypothetical protein